MDKKIQSALISVFYKDGLDTIVRELYELGVTIYSTGGTQQFIESLGVSCVGVESLTTYPSILGGRVKTLHPAVFGGILGRRANPTDVEEMAQYQIPEIDLVIVDLYPFEETLKNTNEEQAIIEKIDIGGPSMIRAAAKNHKDVVVLAAKKDYPTLETILKEQKGTFSLAQRKHFAALAFEVVMHYDIAISGYFNPASVAALDAKGSGQVLRYGENPHQKGTFYGDLEKWFDKLHGKELSYNNLVDVDAAVQLISEFGTETTFAIIKHTNPCGIASRPMLSDAWKAALAGDPESAFGGVLVTNTTLDQATAEAISEIFFEVLIAPAFTPEALTILQAKKNRILLVQKQPVTAKEQFKSLLGGVLAQDTDQGNYAEWNEVGGRKTTEAERADLIFANLVCKHLKSNAIALVKGKQLVGKGCGQTSRVDALRHALEKAHQFEFDLKGAVLASDAFFPFDDCVKMAHAEGIDAIIQPGGSVRDKDSIAYAVEHHMAMVMTGLRHFRH
ncbi:MAG TPA: bifunctional phosphoribosylaminoimidazolecarboxamide formyltransferase/IMP cyclohydrolase [Dinghuibacter sp.]|jgi:phosphoribosylaminoimidazolecarboxamide formyltransferase/IMP cyclohydrolase|uniref:bifunctional phosphoribosylaminoimidazolecarboxamide formyltransferase/IMP cyclohydrolase n=1 Tax=Dinghuibacter sp. TaxID=2024697 RepID=UPI002BAA1CFD|nr:bifunctional phosphoribosylaminoimidazolecarboxamide formyltransferase/IMP cyclohydrolase [Dinghuibacter sp.]HTJ13633.1 bifunctional phosphoribosylaminoimidazolecarboxamide formyltransferase/IMP cyclohydrolase [Dinghuibacter sp.]